ncbi:hypothetical protein [Methylophilus sp.]|uniref:hypothetical protein n=1 Tax=Methylophilus sp. TaxID=29541 RepID=UPI00403734DF
MPHRFSKFKTWLFVAIASLLASCVSVDQMQQKLAQSSAPQVASVAEMTYTPLKTGVEQTVLFGEKTPTFQFQHGKGYYAAFELTETGKPRLVKVKTYWSHDHLPSASILVPNLLVLDKNKQQIGKIENYRLDTDSSLLSGLTYYADLPIPANAAYLVAFAATTHSEKISAYSGDGTEFILPLAPAGKFLISAGESLPLDADFSKALIKDSFKSHAVDKVDFFYVETIAGKSIKNSRINSIEVNRGKGARIYPALIDRQVSANKPVTLGLAAKTQYGAPIQELFKKVYQVKGEITFTPQKDKKYVVKGQLAEGAASVWLEDAETHQVMDKKIVGDGK